MLIWPRLVADGCNRMNFYVDLVPVLSSVCTCQPLSCVEFGRVYCLHDSPWICFQKEFKLGIAGAPECGGDSEEERHKATSCSLDVLRAV